MTALEWYVFGGKAHILWGLKTSIQYYYSCFKDKWPFVGLFDS